MTDSAGLEEYTYDANRRLKTVTRGTAVFTYNADDELLLKDGPSGRCDYTWDANGNMLSQCGETWAYNDANQLTSVTKNADTMTFTYDGDGKRLTAADGALASQITRYQWDINSYLPQLARENNGDGALRRRYVQGQDTVSMTTSGGTYYYHYDGLGSVTDVTDSTGAHQLEYRYEAFGDLRQHQQHSTSAPGNYLRYTGEYYDTFTETYHLRARQYDTHLGRFTQTDPAPSAIMNPYLSSYVYANNQATRLTDPSGRTVIEESPGPEGSLFFFMDEVTNSGELQFVASDFTLAAFILAYISVAGLGTGDVLMFFVSNGYGEASFALTGIGPAAIAVTAMGIDSGGYLLFQQEPIVFGYYF